MIRGKTITKRDVFDKPRGKIKIGTLEANTDITATENIFQWLHLVEGGWVSAGAKQQYIKWEVVSDPIEPPPPEPDTPKYIKGKTLSKRDVFDKPRSKIKVGTVDANTDIVATENIFQWLHLAEGGWVSAGAKQQYIKWEVVSGSPEPPSPEPPPSGGFREIIKGKTIIKRDVSDKPNGEVIIGRVEANIDIIATENQIQWLHLENGGWINAGREQQYAKWEVVTVPVEPSPPPGPVETPAPPVEPWPITEIKQSGKIATLLVDWQNPKWDYKPRQFSLEKQMAYPQTVTFNSIPDKRKGPAIPLKDRMADYVGDLNGEKIKELILRVGSGWVNIPTPPGHIERLTWGANHVIVTETRVVEDVEYSNVYALSCNETDLLGTFFDKDMRLVIHKYNVLTKDSRLMKMSTGRDCYTPLITDPDLNNGEMWIPSEYLEFWPELPFTLSDGTQIIEYELFGYAIYGLRADGKAILLRDPDGFKTNWRIDSPEVPI